MAASHTELKPLNFPLVFQNCGDCCSFSLAQPAPRAERKPKFVMLTEAGNTSRLDGHTDGVSGEKRTQNLKICGSIRTGGTLKPSPRDKKIVLFSCFHFYFNVSWSCAREPS